jgi:FkbM family methyltransferase
VDAHRPQCSNRDVPSPDARGRFVSAVSARRARLQSALKIALFQRLRRRPGLFDLAKRLARRLGHRHAEHDILTAYARTQGAVHVLQVGAHDGLSNDPVREFLVSRRDWRGTLVEPVPRLVAQLRQSYRDHPNVRIVQGALARTSGPTTLHTFTEHALSQLPYYADQLASLDRAHLQKHFPDRADLDALIEAVTVDAWSPSDFLARFALGRVDVLVIDVEGRDREVLEAFPFAQNHPDIVLFESAHFSSADRGAIHALLTTHGYTLHIGDRDTIAVARTLDGPAMHG